MHLCDFCLLIIKHHFKHSNSLFVILFDLHDLQFEFWNFIAVLFKNNDSFFQLFNQRVINHPFNDFNGFSMLHFLYFGG